MRNLVVDIRNVTFRYRIKHASARSVKQVFINTVKRETSNVDIVALKNINFQIDAGDVVGIVGNNGAGKSTLLKVITGILPPSDGEIEVHGQIAPIIELGVGFSPELTCRENIELLGVLHGYKRREMRESIDEIVTWAGLNDYLDLPIRTFSTGMVARLAFSIATFRSRELLIVDEVLSVGDQAFQAKSLERLDKLLSEGEAAILVSHDLSLIANRATKVLWLDQGRQMMFGKTEEVISAYRQN